MERGSHERAYRPRHIGQSIGVVRSGIVAGILITIGTDMVVHAIAVVPPWDQPIGDKPLAKAYRTVYGVAGSYAGERHAPDRAGRSWRAALWTLP
jgi:hypothetical protein